MFQLDLFRVNAGSVNMYVMMADMSTKYISELTSGDRVLLIDHSGKTRIASIGRVKIEHRPLILLKWSNRNGNNYHACIQQAETVRLVSSAGKTVSITELCSETERFRPKNSEVNRLFGDNSLLLKLTDWNPKYSGMDGFTKGMIKTIEWYVENKDIFVNKDKAYVI